MGQWIRFLILLRFPGLVTGPFVFMVLSTRQEAGRVMQEPDRKLDQFVLIVLHHFF
jgi:hypothetical protein